MNTTPTPRTDAFRSTWPNNRRHNWPATFEAAAFEELEQLERELAETRTLHAYANEQRKVVDNARMTAEEQRDKATAELEAWRSEQGPNGWWVKHEEHLEQEELWTNANAELRNQRDTLKEALEHAVQRIRDFEDFIAGRRGNPPSVHAALALASKAITATKSNTP